MVTAWRRVHGNSRAPTDDESLGGERVGMTRDINPIPERYLDNRQAAHYLKLSPRTLDRLRLTGQGPRFRKFGRRVIYAIEDLEVWANERIVGSVGRTP
jgi:hypothetical protein